MQRSHGLIVVVDDDDDIRLALSMLLTSAGYQVLEAADPKDLARVLARHQPGLVLLDMNFTRDTTSGTEGLEVLAQLTAQGISTVLMTAWGNVELAVTGMQQGAADFIEKPWDNKKLLAIVEKHRRYSPVPGNASSKTQPISPKITRAPATPWVAQSAAMQQLEGIIEQVADTQASVLILGENGTGKSLLAQRLHQLSARKSAPFVAVNMGSIPDNLFESELFGHTKGAFTDARAAREGRFELAEGGTLFLDEVGTLPATVQPKLLRVLETGDFEAVGASQTRTADVRIISATNADLEQLVRDGCFRQDLLYRLNTFVIKLPVLRQRQEDILPLAQHFLTKFVHTYNKPQCQLSNDTLAALKAYSWPGNVRELSHVIERAVILCRGSLITTEHLCLPAQSASKDKGDSLALQPLDELELEMVTKALAKYQGHISKAAAALGISRNALYRRMEKHQICKEDFDLE